MSDWIPLQRRVVAALVGKFGPHRLEQILDAVQEAVILASQKNQHSVAWVKTVAERKLIDELRKHSKESELEEWIPDSNVEVEDELKLYLLLCNPKLTPIEQVCLMLSTLAGLKSSEIANLLLENPEATQKRVTRAKQKLTKSDFEEDPSITRIQTVLNSIYLIFTAGHESAIGPEHIRVDLALIATNLAEDLDVLTTYRVPELSALLALMHFNLSRFPARLNEKNEIILLEDQDPSKYSKRHLQLGFKYLERAQKSPDLTRFHLEAGMAASIAIQDTASVVLEWNRMLLRHYPSPMVRLSYAISVGKALGADQGIAALDELKWDSILVSSPHFHAAYGYFYSELSQTSVAAECFRTAMTLSMSDPIKRTFEKRLLVLENRTHNVAE